jgi:hypothetical protein
VNQFELLSKNAVRLNNKTSILSHAIFFPGFFSL